MAKQKFTQEQVITAVQETKGLVYLAAKKLGCDPETVNNYANRYPKVRAAINNARAEVVDVAEAKLYAALLEGQAWAITFVLKGPGRIRGYVEKSEVVHEGNPQNPIHVFSHGAAVASLAARSNDYHPPSGADQDDSDGTEMG